MVARGGLSIGRWHDCSRRVAWDRPLAVASSPPNDSAACRRTPRVLCPAPPKPKKHPRRSVFLMVARGGFEPSTRGL